ncbi:hypothetical protein BDV11DRAFT_173981 [Aspergillus similis]
MLQKMNRDVAIAMYLTIFGSVLILIAMWLTNGFSRIKETLSSPFCLCPSRSRSRNRDRFRRALDECELEGEIEWQTRRPRPLVLTERCSSGIQRTLTQDEYTSAFFDGWYLPYNVRGPSQTESEPEREPEVNVDHEDLPRYEHPPAYTSRRLSTENREEGSNSHRESLDVTEGR